MRLNIGIQKSEYRISDELILAATINAFNPADMDILFWSGGKDAYLALQFYRQDHPKKKVQLLTTYDEPDEIVPHQNIPLSHIKKQSADLGLDLITVALPPGCPNDMYLERISKELDKVDETIEYLLFGDWHLEDIRRWREKVFEQMGYSCQFPIWQKSIHELLPVLFLKPITVEISAVSEEFQHLIRVGETYDQALIRQIQHQPKKIDPLGEHGEFHTKLTFKDLNDIIV